jgi:hypothetical protein
MGKTPTWEEFENKGPLDGKTWTLFSKVCIKI